MSLLTDRQIISYPLLGSSRVASMRHEPIPNVLSECKTTRVDRRFSSGNPSLTWPEETSMLKLNPERLQGHCENGGNSSEWIPVISGSSWYLKSTESRSHNSRPENAPMILIDGPRLERLKMFKRGSDFLVRGAGGNAFGSAKELE